jgi:signal transduction histidine kinase
MDNTSNNEIINDQLSFVMHEIHTSLNSITQKLHFLSRKDLSRRDEQEIVKEGILDACNYADTIRMFLDYLQLSENPDNYFANATMRSVDLYRDFKNPNEYFKSVMKKKRIAYNIKKADEWIPDIEAFPIIHAISNIMIDNAVKYAPEDTEIRCIFEKNDNDIVITMENDGPYLPPDEVKQIFNKGIRGTNAMNANIRGHGYGMDFLERIIQAHDGIIEVQSQKNYSLGNISYGLFACTVTLPIS